MAAATVLVEWIKAFRCECHTLGGILRGAHRDNALRHTVFHREAMACCRRVARWYLECKRGIIASFLRHRSRRRRRAARQKRRAKAAVARARDRAQRRSETSAAKTPTKVRARKPPAVVVVSPREEAFRDRVLARIVRCGLACSAELSLGRRNTVPVALALLASLGRIHCLLSSCVEASRSSGEAHQQHHRGGVFGRWMDG